MHIGWKVITIPLFGHGMIIMMMVGMKLTGCGMMIGRHGMVLLILPLLVTMMMLMKHLT